MRLVSYYPEVTVVRQTLSLLVPSMRLAEDIPTIVPFLEVAIFASFREDVHIFKCPHCNLQWRFCYERQSERFVPMADTCSEDAELSHNCA